MANKKKNLELIKDSFLHENEKIAHAIFGAYETKSLGNDTVKNGVFAATEERIIFCAKRLSGYNSEIFHYNKISTFELSKKFMGNIVTFYSSGNKVSIKWINDDELDDFIEYVNKKIVGKDTGAQNVLKSEHNTSNDDDELETLKKNKNVKRIIRYGSYNSR